MDLLEKFKTFIKTNGLQDNDQRLLLAVSGGIDSVVMERLFREAGYYYGIVHCNFQLRGAESDADEDFVRRMAAAQNVPFFTKRFDTKTHAEGKGISIQMAARELRYAWFAEICLEQGYGTVATAHNLNDSVETVLLNFVRGTGLSGLTGIAARTPLPVFTPPPAPPPPKGGRGGVTPSAPTLPFGGEAGLVLIRPLLFATRPAIEAFARARNLFWREDSSNISDDYARNFIRHHVVPRLEQLNPDFVHTAQRNLSRLSDAEMNYNYLANKYLEDGEGVIDKQKAAAVPAPGQLLHYGLKAYGFSAEQARQLAENLDHTGFELQSASGFRLLADRTKIIVSEGTGQKADNIKIQPDDLMVSLPEGKKMFFLHDIPAGELPSGSNSVVVDAGKLRFPLTLRRWQPGDFFYPFGMNGHRQKLQDFFTNLKLSRFEKEEVWVLENGDGNIIWVIGHRPDERFRVMDGTENILKINYV